MLDAGGGLDSSYWKDFVATLSDKERALLDKALAPILARSDVAVFEQRNSE